MMPNRMLRAALAYAKMGLRVFPCHSIREGACSCGKNGACDSPGKHPRVNGGFEAGTTDPDTITEWWTRWEDANIAVATGAVSGIVAIDADKAKFGDESLRELEAENGPLPDTVQSLTGGGGTHDIFRHPGGRVPCKVGLRPGLDVRGDGGYAILPPSNHPSGRAYCWEGAHRPGEVPFAEIPGWLLEMLRGNGGGGGNGAHREPIDVAEVLLDGVPEGERDDTLFRFACKLRRADIPMEVARDLVLRGAAAAKPPFPADIASEKVDRVWCRYPAGGTQAHSHAANDHAAEEPEWIKYGPAVGSNGHTAEGVDPHKVDVFVPGAHTTDEGEYFEVGTNDFTLRVIGALPPGAIYRRGNLAVGELTGTKGEREFTRFSEHALRPLVDRNIRLTEWVTRGRGDDKEQVVIYHPTGRDYAGLILAIAATDTRVRDLKLLTRYPVYYGDSLTLAKPGWNEDVGIYFDVPPELAGLEPARVSKEEAGGFLRDLVLDFPFKDDASRENLFGMLLTPIVRPAIDGNVPMHVIEASIERTGKSLLTQVILGDGILGSKVPNIQVGSTEEEIEKRITALILRGATIINFDNLAQNRELDSASLSSLLTSRVWSGRRLSASEVPAVPNLLMVVGSANNLRASAEIAKRVVPIVLQPENDHPQDRTNFVHADIHTYVRGRRRELLGILLGMVENWKAAGRPAGPHVLGGFEEWIKTVGGIMTHQGFTNHLTSMRAWHQRADDWSADARSLVGAWATKYRGEWVTASQLLNLASDNHLFTGVFAGKESGWAATFARRVLLRLTNRPVGDHLVIRDGEGSNSRYRVTTASGRQA